MNKRIEELADQCREKHGRGFGNGVMGDYEETFNEEKFAELIVKECLVKIKVWEQDSRNHVSYLLAHHFGVGQ
jgi:hypothetical protein